MLCGGMGAFVYDIYLFLRGHASQLGGRFLGKLRYVIFDTQGVNYTYLESIYIFNRVDYLVVATELEKVI